MKINSNQAQSLKGSFSTEQKNNKMNNDKNSSIQKADDKYEKMIGNIQEQIKNVQDNKNYDSVSKKQKISDLQSQIQDIQKMKQEEEATKINKPAQKTAKDSEEVFAENMDGDKVILSNDMKNMMENDIALKKAEEKGSAAKDLNSKATILESQIETDKGRGVDTAKKEESLSKVQDKMAELNNKEDDQVVVNKEDEQVKATPKKEEDTTQVNPLQF